MNDMHRDESQHSTERQEEAVNGAAVPCVSEHDTLKYHLLGPSLTKAGQDSVDQQKVILFPDYIAYVGSYSV